MVLESSGNGTGAGGGTGTLDNFQVFQGQYGFGLIVFVVTSVILIMGAVIKMGKVVTDQTSSTVYSVPSYSVAKSENTKRVKEFVIRTWRDVVKEWKGQFVGFIKNLPTRFWNFYVDAFLIAAYRKEWGKYKDWNFRAPPRPEKVGLLKVEMKKVKEEQKENEGLEPGSTSNPAPTPHNHALCRRVKINVGGTRYETQERTLARYPTSLLGDPSKRLRYFDPQRREYYFDRNQLSFEVILHFYQSGGNIKRPEIIPQEVLIEDLKFYEIPDRNIYTYMVEEGLTGSDKAEDTFPLNLFMRKVWLLFDYPESSTQAQLVAVLSIFTVAVSLFIFCTETLQTFTEKPRFTVNTTSGGVILEESNPMDITDPFFFTETVCSIWFLLEYVARLLSCPQKIAFLRRFVNLVDLLAIVPYFFQLTFQTKVRSTTVSSFSVIRLIRLVRVFRIFKLSRHSRGLKILGKTLKTSMNEMLLLVFFVMVGVILFSSAIYFAEMGLTDTYFTSVPDQSRTCHR